MKMLDAKTSFCCTESNYLKLKLSELSFLQSYLMFQRLVKLAEYVQIFSQERKTWQLAGKVKNFKDSAATVDCGISDFLQ